MNKITRELAENFRFSGEVNRLVDKRVYLKFEPFFHAYITEFIKKLNRDGIPGLLNLENQTLGNPYLHSPWKPVGDALSKSAIGSACLIEGSFGKTATRPGNFEAVVREGSNLVHYWHDNSNVSSSWQKAQIIANSVTGAGCIIQRKFSDSLDVVVLEGAQLNHYTNPNVTTGQPWIFQGAISTGATASGCLIESDFLSAFQRSLEVILLQTEGLVHYRKDNQTGAWIHQEVISKEATGAGCIIQSSFQSGDHGNFEVVVLEGSKLVHYWKDHTKNGWNRAAVITDRATSSGWII
ncbi:MAG: hypothetical protein NTU99_07560, partial [Pseudanabaena sp. LacPavin_0818_WC45_MAG_42_6]|nr:hypothetical protein [Pseudanabaena sp. LacPavin_0818_WC45_MAG_42_6]